jgi:hypothetical protein
MNTDNTGKEPGWSKSHRGDAEKNQKEGKLLRNFVAPQLKRSSNRTLLNLSLPFILLR